MKANIFERPMTWLQRVTLLPQELPDGIAITTIGGFLSPEYQKRYEWQITAIRALCPTLEDKKRNEQQVQRLKRTLPAGIMSAVTHGLSEGDIEQRNGVVAIDIDGKDNPAIYDWESFKAVLATSPYIAYVGQSVSGLGVFVLIPIAYPEKHAQHIAAIVEDMGRKTFTFVQDGESEPTTLHGINIDTAPTNPASKRFVSLDLNPYVNTEAEVYCKLAEPLKQRTYAQRPTSHGNARGSTTWNLREWLDSHLVTYNERERHGGIQYVVSCPWSHLHSSRNKAEAAVFEYPDGRAGFKCMHSHCTDKNWHAFRQFYERTDFSSETILSIIGESVRPRNIVTNTTDTQTPQQRLDALVASNPDVALLVNQLELEAVDDDFEPF